MGTKARSPALHPGSRRSLTTVSNEGGSSLHSSGEKSPSQASSTARDENPDSTTLSKHEGVPRPSPPCARRSHPLPWQLLKCAFSHLHTGLEFSSLKVADLASWRDARTSSESTRERQGNPDSLSRRTDERKQRGDLLTCGQGEAKGSGAPQATAVRVWERERESPWQVIRKNWHAASGNSAGICAGVWLGSGSWNVSHSLRVYFPGLRQRQPGKRQD